MTSICLCYISISISIKFLIQLQLQKSTKTQNRKKKKIKKIKILLKNEQILKTPIFTNSPPPDKSKGIFYKRLTGKKEKHVSSVTF